jgi:ribulose-phosphate 3-epimerase
VQLLAVTPGKQGNVFQDSVLEKIKALKEYDPEISVWVDGGLNRSTLPKILNLSIDNAVIGSAIFGTEDPVKSLKDFQTAYGSK